MSHPYETNPHAPSLMHFYLAIRQAGVTEHNILSAFEKTPRLAFLPPILQPFATTTEAIQVDDYLRLEPISLLARQLQLLNISQKHLVLEFGSGTGYTLALLSHLARRVFGIERIRMHANESAWRLRRLERGNTIVVHGFSPQNIANIAPFDRILVSVAVQENSAIIQDLAQLLKPNGIMIMPISGHGQPTKLHRISRSSDGEDIKTETLFHASQSPIIEGLG